MVALFSFLLVIFLLTFTYFSNFADALHVSSTGDYIIASNFFNQQISVSMNGLRIFLGGGAVFCELIIIIISVFDRVLDTLKAAIRPVATLVPLYMFGLSVYNTFSPILTNLRPGGGQVGVTSVVNMPKFGDNVFGTFLFMLLYILVTAIFNREKSTAKPIKFKFWPKRAKPKPKT